MSLLNTTPEKSRPGVGVGGGGGGDGPASSSSSGVFSMTDGGVGGVGGVGPSAAAAAAAASSSSSASVASFHPPGSLHSAEGSAWPTRDVRRFAFVFFYRVLPSFFFWCQHQKHQIRTRIPLDRGLPSFSCIVTGLYLFFFIELIEDLFEPSFT